jgi:AcrR family transcriptional regulator
MIQIEKNQNQILDAADVLFRQLGYNKTTMMDIAKESGISCGGLYRFFESKQKIGEGCVIRCFQKLENILKEVIHQEGKGAGTLLEEFVLANLHYYHEQYSTNPRFNELILFVTNERRDLLKEHLDRRAALLAEILEEGNRTGEFGVGNVLQTSKTIVDALSKFTAARYIALEPYSIKEMESQAKEVIGLLICGIGKR